MVNRKSFLSGQETVSLPPACLWEVSCLFSCHFLFWSDIERPQTYLPPISLKLTVGWKFVPRDVKGGRRTRIWRPEFWKLIQPTYNKKTVEFDFVH